MNGTQMASALEAAVSSRIPLIDARHETAFRLFNGFTEGCPELAIDVYARTLLVHNYGDDPAQNESLIQESVEYIRTSLEWLRTGVIKARNGKTQNEKRGRLFFGGAPDRKVKEHGVWYSIDLTMNRDASLYLDSRNLRKWLTDHSKGKSILNTFAYTGSLGVAAMAGGAERVVQHDLNRDFLNVAKASYTLNGFPIHKQDFASTDFFTLVSKLKRMDARFDCVILDPPFFSTTRRGRVDQQGESARVINKVRPLIKDGGLLVAINNALYLSGKEYMQTLESLCADGYLKIRELIPVPDDFTGYPDTRVGTPISDPAPFNHSTKIAILDVKRKGG